MEEPQKLFRLPGTIEEEEERELGTQGQQQQQTNDTTQRPESPLLVQKITGTNSTLPRNITLVRVSTQSSSIGGVGRQDSYRPLFSYCISIVPLEEMEISATSKVLKRTKIK
ncbi:hypothetical protein PV325_005297 [Microctonus aethiopoides]|nr:hypothetical protein PV325_005297 [Microctonus aethiopoides]